MKRVVAPKVSEPSVNALYKKLRKEAEDAGYHLNPDVKFTKQLIRSILINQQRYGYWACPCRFATGIKKEDVDIICPCDYRDADLNQFGACYCGLYVSADIAKDKKKAVSIPERRPTREEREKMKRQKAKPMGMKALKMPVWRCKVCGYLCARDEPPELCPICKAGKERFERFM